MKTSTKVLLGIGVFGVAVYAISDTLEENFRHAANRHKVKHFVSEKFDGNEKLLNIVDHLSDDDLDSIMGILGKIKDGRKQVSVYGDNVKDTTQDLKDKLGNLVDSVL